MGCQIISTLKKIKSRKREPFQELVRGYLQYLKWLEKASDIFEQMLERSEETKSLERRKHMRWIWLSAWLCSWGQGRAQWSHWAEDVETGVRCCWKMEFVRRTLESKEVQQRHRRDSPWVAGQGETPQILAEISFCGVERKIISEASQCLKEFSLIHWL